MTQGAKIIYDINREQEISRALRVLSNAEDRLNYRYALIFLFISHLKLFS